MKQLGRNISGVNFDRVLAWAVVVAAGLAVFALVSTSSLREPANAAALLWTLFESGPAAAVYLLAAAGWGMLMLRPIDRAAGRNGDRPALAVGLGVSFMLTVSHLMGVSGCFGGAMGISGRHWAIVPVAVGLAASAWPAIRSLHRGDDLATLAAPIPSGLRIPVAFAWACGGTVLVVAACNPPGVLWSSEFGGYDSLSYHLQLPREWLALGVLRPVEHNVYSFLPGYIEAAFLHLGAMAGTPDLLDRDGRVLISCQLLSAGLALLAAWAVGRVALAAIRLTGLDAADARGGAAIAASTAVVVPWMVVVGSLAYSESAMILLGACAACVALERPAGQTEGSPRGSLGAVMVRGALAGWLVGVACGAKLTAILMFAPAVGVMLCAAAGGRRHAALACLAASAAGLAAIAPWMIRNWIASGNPVFPHAAGLLGAGHWTIEQVERYAAAHRFTGGWFDRLRLVFLADQSDPAGARHRGPMHHQWAWFFPCATAGLAVLIAWARTRTAGAILAAALATQLIAWITLTHMQSRFLLPAVVPGAAALGMLLAAANTRRRAIAMLSTWMLVPAAGYLVYLYKREGSAGHGPNILLAVGPGAFTGSIGRAMYDALDPDERRRFLSEAGPTVYLNMTARTQDVLYLLGDATPLYYTGKVLYNTTYDSSAIAQAIERHPDSPPRWVDALLARGVTRVLVNYAEIDRLTRSGWIDPRITPDSIQRSIGAFGRIERAWNNRSLVLYRLPS